ncbi:MAG: patatin-like phospholipase family protein, partial [Acidobacteriota bacterium]
MTLRTPVLMLSLALLAVPPVAGMAPEPPDCDGELPFVLNAAVAPSGRFPVQEVEELARALFTGLYRQHGSCSGTRALQVNLAVASEYHVLHWLEEGSVDVAVVSDLTLDLLRRAEVDLLEIDLDGIDFDLEELEAEDREALAGLPERILPKWRPTYRAIVHPGEAESPGGSVARSPERLLRAHEAWLRSGLGDDPAALAAVLRGGEEHCPVLDPGGDPGVRLTLPSHLSSAGFVQPVVATRERLNPHLEGIHQGRDGVAQERLSEAAEACFWRRYFDRVCFRLEEQRIGERGEGGAGPSRDACTRRWRAEARDRGKALVEIRIGREAVAGARTAEAGNPGGGDLPRSGPGAGPGADSAALSRDHLVIRRSEAEAVFRGDAFPPAGDRLPESVRSLIERASRSAPGGEPRLLEFFRAMAVPEPYLGTRTFSFTAREAAELVELHQRFSDRRRLSLVLPGGGVKAAFQSRLLEGLYRDGVLRNTGAAGDEDGPGTRVDAVVGTSGGALLGWFVARLDERGPFELSEVLWERPSRGEAGEPDYLSAFDVFGSTDLPRYLSLIVIYLVFAATLASCSLRHRGWLAPERAAPDAPAVRPSLRPGLLGLLVGVLGLTPLLLRWVNGTASVEHVPEFEGLLFAVLVGLAVFADQGLIFRPGAEGRPEEAPARRRVWSPPAALLAVGSVLVLAPVGVKLASVAASSGGRAGAWARFLEGHVTAWEGYVLVGAVAAGLMLSAVRRGSGVAGLAAGAGLFVLAFAGGTVVAVGVLQLTPEIVLGFLDDVPLLFFALGVILLTVGLARLAGAAGYGARRGSRHLARGYAWLGQRLARLWGRPAVRRVTAVIVTCLVVLDLSRPEARTVLTSTLAELAGAESKLAAPRGGLAVCLGAALLMMGGFMALHHRRNRYRLERTREFVDGMVFVVLGLALGVYVVLGAVTFAVSRADRAGWLPESPLVERLTALSLFELTPAFWVGLVVTSLAGSLLLVGWGRAAGRSGRSGGLGERLRGALVYLCSRHPNGHLVSRRFVRLGLFAVGSLLWWNFVLAPALYGNRMAWGYLQAADERFTSADLRSRETPTPYRLTAHYLAPANALEAGADGTRFVLAVAGDDLCPPVPSSPGVVWRTFHAVHDADDHDLEGAHRCRDLVLDEEEDRHELLDYVFASGSPFPAFPARRVLVDDERREALVDGGYSNNVPLQAAADLGSAQA